MFTLPELPYSLDALEPVISKEIMDIHYHKHHQSYLDKINDIITKYDPNLFMITNESTLAIHINTFPKEIQQETRNNLGGHINHSFFWGLLTKENTLKYKKNLIPIFEKHYGSIDTLLSEFTLTAKKSFGSGWVWICFNPLTEFLEIRSYNNQDCPLFDNMYPVLGIDLWEHAYYLKYKNNKSEYIDQFMTIINWKYVYDLLISYTEDSNSCCQDTSCKDDICTKNNIQS